MPATATTSLTAAKEALEPLSEKVQEKMQEGVVVSKRALRSIRAKADDLLDDATHEVKHHPWQAVGISLGLGVLLGVGAGFLLGRMAPRSRRSFLHFF